MNRRTLILSGLGSAAALLVGWVAMPMRSRLGSMATIAPTLAGGGGLDGMEGGIGLNGWIRIAQDGAVQLAMNRSEMGQGVHTALAMLVAEELDVPLERVQLIDAGFDAIYGNVASFTASLPVHPRDAEPGREAALVKASQWLVGKVARELGINLTGGSSSIADAWGVLPLAAATARAQLLGAASLRWRLPADELVVQGGVVSHASGPSAHYGELARIAAATPTGEVRLKPRSAWRLIGTAAQRTDAAPKGRGAARFGMDVRLPEQRYAVVRHCPMLGGGLGAIDVDAALAVPGVERVVRLGSVAGSTAGLAVVATSTWAALQGAKALRVAWNAPPAGTVNSADILSALMQTAARAAAESSGHVFHQRGDIASLRPAEPGHISQIYRAPYLAHAAMEPINCTARVAAGRVEVWAPTQVPGLARALAAQVAGVPEEAVTLHVTYLGGGFGRRLDMDFIGQAVRIAMEASGRPVQLVWPREEDITHDFYRPAGVAVLQARLDAATGLPIAWQITSAGDAITPRMSERTMPALASRFELPDKTTSEGLFDLPYGVPNQRIAHVATHSGVPVGFWRSVGHSHNAFFSECFVDELAFAAKQDPLAYRLALLADAPRHAAVLQLAASKAGWGSALPAGVARGVALHESFGSVVAMVAEVTLMAGRPRVQRVVCAADVGTVINPGLVRQQLEGGVVFGLSAALAGRIDIEASVVKQSNFTTYPVLTIAGAPRVDCHLIDSIRPPSGVGEIAVPPIAPAVANALFSLTGRRCRELPLAVA